MGALVQKTIAVFPFISLIVDPAFVKFLLKRYIIENTVWFFQYNDPVRDGVLKKR
jgi:hypothetical protein